MTTSASAMLQSTGADRRMLPGTVAAANRCGDRPQVSLNAIIRVVRTGRTAKKMFRRPGA